MDKEAWLKKSEEILTDVKEWRREHKKATFVEIEAEIHHRMMRLEAELVQDAVQDSESRTWGKGADHPAPLCPNCKTPLQTRGEKKRTLQGNGGQEINLSRMHGSCPECGQRFFPSR